MPKGDREILKADPEDGTTPIANLLLEALAIARLTGKEKGAVLYLWRVTYGWQVNGNRLKEQTIPLKAWSIVIQTDESKASRIISGLVTKKVIKRNSPEPGHGYSYSMNTRVAEWGDCLNRQGLSEMARQGLPKTTRVALPKTATPSDTNLVSPKEILNKGLNKIYKESKKEKQKQVLGLPLWIKKETWDAFLEVRKKLGAPPTDKAIELLIKELKKLHEQGDDPNEVLNQSIMRGWRGVFPLKRGDSNGTNQKSIPGNRPAGAFANLD